MKTLLVMIAAMFLIGCSESPAPKITRTVVETLDCTEHQAGYGGLVGRCRVLYNDGTRGTVMRPVAVGDLVECYAHNPNSPYNCKIL